MNTHRVVCFCSCRLDLSNQQLWRDGQAVPLRPKTFAVLRYLVEHAGRLVTRDELIKAVWRDTHGAERGPKRCILELRAALGDQAVDPQVIETVGRLGYRFVARLTNGAASPLRSQSEAGTSQTLGSQPPAPTLVGRDEEVTQLHRWLERALNGERQVVFVTGEPGIGKTSIVESFVHQVATHRASAAWPGDVWVAHGQCIETYGEGEPYMPVMEAFGGLARSGHPMFLDLLRRHAPSWLAQLPALVSEGELETLQLRLRGATQLRMLREIADLIGAVASQAPLLLVLEDLHWSDYSTLDFVSAVTQGRDSARLFLIGTYRSTDIADDHPLRPVTQELLSHGQAHELPLAGLGALAVERYLDTRFPRHAFSPRFADLLHRCTEGSPLFLVNLVDDLIAQQLVLQSNGCWEVRVPEETIVAHVPQSSRRLIEKQMARVAPDTQPLLEAGSIVGIEFAAEAIASALQTSSEHVEKRCDALARQERFLRRVRVDEWPDGTQSTRYGFRHAVYQQLWSERVPAPQAQRFHRSIGERQEQSYGQRTGEIAAELAVHFDKGRDYPRAVQYRQRAAQNALVRSAHREAIDHLTKTLELLTHLPDTPARAQQELALQILLGVPLTATMGYAAADVERVYSRALELSEQVKDTSQIVQALLGLWVFYYARGDLQTARRLSERCLRETQQARAAEFALDAHNALGDSLLWLGESAAAREQLEHSLALLNQRQHHSYIFYDVTHPGVGCLSHLAWALWQLGYPGQARQRSTEALALARELSHPYSLGYALTFAAALDCFCRDPLPTQERAEAAIELGGEHGFPLWVAMGTILRGWARVGQGAAELDQIHGGLAGFEAIGADLGRPAFLALLAESHGKSGQPEAGLRVLADAEAVASKTGERLYEPEIYRLRGELTLQLGANSARPRPSRSGRASTLKSDLRGALAREAEASFLKALEVARRQGAKSWELRAAISFARLRRGQGKVSEARAILSPIHGWFAEGFDTADLKDAARLLDELAHAER